VYDIRNTFDEFDTYIEDAKQKIKSEDTFEANKSSNESFSITNSPVLYISFIYSFLSFSPLTYNHSYMRALNYLYSILFGEFDFNSSIILNVLNNL
jgi:hypothetical protein